MFALPRLLVLAFALGACATSNEIAADSSSAGAASDAPADLRATVEIDIVIARTDRCVLDIRRPVVDVPGNPTATRAIADAIEAFLGPPRPANELCSGDFATDLSQSFDLGTNERGILSLVLHAQTPQPRSRPLVFDLKDGRSLALVDILSARGLERVAAACEAELGAESGCRDFAATGVELDRDHLTVRFDTGDVEEAPFQIPWSQIQKEIVAPSVRDYLGRR